MCKFLGKRFRICCTENKFAESFSKVRLMFGGLPEEQHSFMIYGRSKCWEFIGQKGYPPLRHEPYHNVRPTKIVSFQPQSVERSLPCGPVRLCLCENSCCQASANLSSIFNADFIVPNTHKNCILLLIPNM